MSDIKERGCIHPLPEVELAREQARRLGITWDFPTTAALEQGFCMLLGEARAASDVRRVDIFLGCLPRTHRDHLFSRGFGTAEDISRSDQQQPQRLPDHGPLGPSNTTGRVLSRDDVSHLYRTWRVGCSEIALAAFHGVSLDTVRRKVRDSLRLRGQLSDLLTRDGIDTSTWGQAPGTLTLDHLLEEVINGESILSKRDGRVMRDLWAVGIDVIYHSADASYRLVEVSQEFDDGRPARQRSHPTAVSETVKFGENIYAAARRGMLEELGLEVTALDQTEALEIERPSTSYAGLLTYYHVTNFRAALTSDQFNPHGYVEYRDGVTTRFAWEIYIPR